MKTILTSALLVILFVPAIKAQVKLENDATPGGTISVQPMEMDFGLKAGETKEFKVYVSNKLAKKMSFKVYLSDWRRDSVGAHVYSMVGTEPHSCSRWLALDKKFLEVQPGEVGIINGKMQIPDSIDAEKEMKWAMIFVESVEESKAPGATKEMISRIQPTLRWGVHVNQTPPTLNANKEFKLISFLPTETKKNEFRILGENTGKVQLLCKSYIELSSVSDGKKTTLTPIEVPVFPGQKRYFDFTLPAELVKGQYTMVGVVDPGSDLDLEAAQMTVDVQ
jgi:hypothetical protein